LAGQGKRRFSIKFNFQMSNGVGLVFVEKLNKKYLIKKPIKAQFNICLFKKLETSLGFLVFNVKLLILIDLNQFGLNY
jgi:hypothetical protein